MKKEVEQKASETAMVNALEMRGAGTAGSKLARSRQVYRNSSQLQTNPPPSPAPLPNPVPMSYLC
eukprot:2873059-Amphidinium_carterae.1